MRVGIITITEGYNYGNKLQNYALLSSIKDISGCEVYTINNGLKGTNNVKFKALRAVRRKILFPKLEHKKAIRQKRFDQFNTEYLNFTKNEITLDNLHEFNNFDLLICGSDQIWNPHYYSNLSINTACFSDKAKRISYAASIGVESIPIDRKEEYKHKIGTMDAISLREKEGADLIHDLTGARTYTHIDPVMLLTKEKWSMFEKKPDKPLPENYMVTYFIVQPEQQMGKNIYEYAAANGLTVINLNCRDDLLWYDIDPNEFVYLIHHAQLVVADSFHATVFSILFRVPFFIFDRNDYSDRNRQNSRLITLLKLCNMEERFNLPIRKENTKNIDFESVDQILEIERCKSKEYLKSYLSEDRIDFNFQPSNCCGCGVCKEICPVNAIELKENYEGFLYPAIDYDKCVKCKQCQVNCPSSYSLGSLMTQVDRKEAYKVYNKNEDERRISSSGGLFLALSSEFLRKGGVVAAAKFTSDYTVEHSLIYDEQALKDYAGSKYVQSRIYPLYSEIKQLVEKGTQVLLFGTPCQIAAIRVFLKKEYTNLYCVDLICHGCPSQYVFREYLRYIEKKNGSPVKKYEFRNKDEGWTNFNTKVEFNNGTIMKEHHSHNVFFRLFLSNMLLRSSCYQCTFRKKERLSDLTLGDFWGVTSHDDKGTSLVISHDSKGEELMQLLHKHGAVIEKADYDAAIRINTAYNKDVSSFTRRTDILASDFSDFAQIENQWLRKSFKSKVKHKLRKALVKK